MAGFISRSDVFGVPDPVLDLNFLITTTLDARITFTSAGGLTYYDVAGVEQVAGANAARFDHDQVTHVPKGLAISTGEAAVISGANLTSWYNQAEGSFVVEYTNGASVVSGQRVIELSGGTSARVLDISHSASLTETVYDGTATIGVLGTLLALTSYKTAAAYRTRDYALTRTGLMPSTSASSVVNTATALQIGRFNTGGNHLNGHIRRIRYWRQRLPNDALQLLTL